MRLIDADEVKKYILTEGFCCDTKADRIHTASLIDELFPAIDAIPTEWIHNIITWHFHLWEEGKDKMFITENVVKIVNHSMIAQVLSQLLKLWEKENE